MTPNRRAANSAPRREADRTLPHDLLAERAVLGAVLLHVEAYHVASGLIQAADFFREAHVRLWQAIDVVVAAGADPDYLTVRDALVRAGNLDEVGGPSYITGLTDGVPRGSHVEHHAAIVKEMSRLREAIYAANKLTARAYDRASAGESAMETAERLMEIAGDAVQGGPVPLSKIVPDAMAEMEKAHEPGRGVCTGLSCGIDGIDEMTAGFHPGDVVIVAARTSQGKTALALNIARHASKSAPVLIFSLEMSRQQLFMRLLAAEARVDGHRVRSGATLSNADWGAIATGIGTLDEAQILIDDSGSIGVAEVRARGRKVKADGGLGLIVVDYIQLMKGRGKFDNRTQEVGSISRGLKAVARELRVPLLVLAQLNRSSEAQGGRKARPPQLSDLRESGDIESDADTVILIWRPDNEDAAEDDAELIIAKQRNGPTGIVKVKFDRKSVRFYEPQRRFT